MLVMLSIITSVLAAIIYTLLLEDFVKWIKGILWNLIIRLAILLRTLIIWLGNTLWIAIQWLGNALWTIIQWLGYAIPFVGTWLWSQARGLIERLLTFVDNHNSDNDNDSDTDE